MVTAWRVGVVVAIGIEIFCGAVSLQPRRPRVVPCQETVVSRSRPNQRNQRPRQRVRAREDTARLDRAPNSIRLARDDERIYRRLIRGTDRAASRHDAGEVVCCVEVYPAPTRCHDG